MKSYTDNPISIAKPPSGLATKNLDKQKRKCYTYNIQKKKAKITMKRGIQKMEEKETRFDRSTERSECLIAEYKKLRKDEAKMSQKSLEDITGVPRQMIIRYEKGKIMPTVRAMNRLLEPLGYQLGIVPLKKEDSEDTQ